MIVMNGSLVPSIPLDIYFFKFMFSYGILRSNLDWVRLLLLYTQQKLSIMLRIVLLPRAHSSPQIRFITAAEFLAVEQCLFRYITCCRFITAAEFLAVEQRLFRNITCCRFLILQSENFSKLLHLPAHIELAGSKSPGTLLQVADCLSIEQLE